MSEGHLLNDWYRLDKNKNVVPCTSYRDMTSGEDKIVGKTTVGESRVSTVFLGLDHSWSGGEPLVFKTMIFDGPGDGYQWRYYTWDQADKNHKNIVKLLEKGESAEQYTEVL